MAFSFRLRKCINFSKFSKAGNTEIIPVLTSRLLRVDVSPTGSRRKILIGKIIPIYQGFSDSISYKIYSESQLILLPEIGMYSLRFISSGVMKFGNVRFFEKIGQLSNTELRNVQSLLGMVAEMASADTRNLIQSIEATSATIAADKAAQEIINSTNAASIAAAQTVATEITEQMVINETFSLPQTAFIVQASGLYHAVMSLVKVDGSKGVQLSLTDADGDDQGFSQLISPYMGDTQKATVELTANQLADNAFPLSFLCQGRKLSAVGGTPTTPPSQGTALQGGFVARLVGNVLTITNPMGVVITTSNADIASAYFNGGDRIYYLTTDGGHGYVMYPYEGGPQWSNTTQADYDFAVNTGVSI